VLHFALRNQHLITANKRTFKSSRVYKWIFGKDSLVENKRKNEVRSFERIEPTLTIKECMVVQISKFITIFYAMFSMFFVAHEVGHYDDVAMHALLPIGIALFVIQLAVGFPKQQLCLLLKI
jgi:hypothetical protein